MLELLPRFGLAPLRQALEHPLPGNPERCLARWTVEDQDHGLWTLERLGPDQTARRGELARLLERLAQDPALAGFLLALQRARASWPALPAAHVPPLLEYIHGLLAAITRRKPEVAARLEPLSGFLDTLPRVLAAQPTVLGHGDLHPPLNVQWGDGPHEPVRAVIDVEFAGARPLLLDAANYMGCAGFEHPSGLTREFLALLPAMVLFKLRLALGMAAQKRPRSARH